MISCLHSVGVLYDRRHSKKTFHSYIYIDIDVYVYEVHGFGYHRLKAIIYTQSEI